MILFTVWTSQGTVFGGTSMHVFDDADSLKQGKQKLIFYFDSPGSSRQDTHTRGGELYGRYHEQDEIFKKEKCGERYKHSMSMRNKMSNESSTDAVLDWLDRLTLVQLARSSTSTDIGQNVGDNEDIRRVSCDSSLDTTEAHDLHSFALLVVDLPLFPHPVMFNEKCAPSATPHTPQTSLAMLAVRDGARTAYERDIGDTVYEFNLTGRNFSGQALQQVVDWEMEMEADSPCEDMYRRLAHDSIRGRGGGDQAIKPNLQEKERLDKVLHAPGDHMKTEEKDLLYRFRYVLTENKMALPKFLLCIDWSSESETAELPILLDLWKQKAPIDVADALKLLSGGKAFQSPLVRQYAVDVLRNASDEELHILLLQLVQALRYEPIIGTGADKEREKAVTDENPDDLKASLVKDNMELDKDDKEYSLEILSPLGRFLVERACASTTVANFFYWYLKVETEDPALGDMFQTVFDVFLFQLRVSSEAGALFERKLLALNEYIDMIISCQKDARDVKGKKDLKESTMRTLLSEENRSHLPNGIDSIPLPLDPSCSITGLNPGTVMLFRSAMYPALIDFAAHKNDIGDDLKFVGEIVSDVSSQSKLEVLNTDVECETSKKLMTYKIIFKSGDDLRQDQLVMQLISLMDSLLKKVNLDLGLLTYGILATGPTDGIMEFVRGSMPISAVLSSYNNSLSAYLKHFNPDPHSPYGVKPEAMDMFVRSCAASCVVTFILGIGDRHLDNVMLRTNGQMFHIDFGFIFGRDPKPLPPPFRFTRAMADAMGGEESDHYKQFQSYCCQAYNWLRKSANLILNMLSLMVNASIPDLSVHEDPSIVLKKVEEKFRLDLTDELAEVFFLGLINESLTALAPRLMELAHQIAVARR
mmetsp:Transcript_6861/g.11418  ORF Transcript_6861/g.11418 Transcript_6861/m.11418 type:complete len:873 (+) Transcript_6861:547-3165(+)